MNGVHDMGGTQGYGPVVPEADEPAFHAEWERRAFALVLAMGGTGAWNLDQSRAARETLPPAQYLASSYYRIWFEGLCKLLVERNLVTEEELADGRRRVDPGAVPRVLQAGRVAEALARGASTSRTISGHARFAVGDRIRTRNLNSLTHTRLPSYCRDKVGTVVRLHGAHVLPDANALGAGEAPEWLYTVSFDAQAIFGTDSSADAICVDCWESYLETA